MEFQIAEIVQKPVIRFGYQLFNRFWRGLGGVFRGQLGGGGPRRSGGRQSYGCDKGRTMSSCINTSGRLATLSMWVF